MSNYKPKHSRSNSSEQQSSQMSKEEYRIKKEQERADAYAMIDEGISDTLESPESFREYLDMQARMDRYSVANTLLIKKQLPEATQLKEFKDWAEAGVTVKRHQKSLMLLEPKEYTRQNGTIGVTYTVKRVFDISQTTARQNRRRERSNDPAKLIPALLETSPIDYDSVDSLPDPNAVAFYDNEKNVLLVKEGVGDSTKVFQAIAQELSLAEIAYNSETYDRNEALFPAVCASYMLCKKYGVDTADIPIDKMPAEWAKLENKEIREKLTMARDCVNEIGRNLYRELNKEKQPRVADHER